MIGREPARRVRVQIAGTSTLEEALFAARLGADAIAFPLRCPGGVHDGLTEEKARAIAAALPPYVCPVVITYVASAREAIDLCRRVGAAVVQFHGEIDDREIPLVRAALPHIRVVRRLSLPAADSAACGREGPEAIVSRARSLARTADALIADTFDPESGRCGATGRVHDWEVTRRVVEESGVPVILAGGLTPQNVACAIQTVRPWAVDVHTGVERADGSRDLERIRMFLEAVARAG